MPRLILLLVGVCFVNFFNLQEFHLKVLVLNWHHGVKRRNATQKESLVQGFSTAKIIECAKVRRISVQLNREQKIDGNAFLCSNTNQTLKRLESLQSITSESSGVHSSPVSSLTI